MQLLQPLIDLPHRADPATDVNAWWEQLADAFEDYDTIFEAASACAFRQDRLAWVVASAYAGALHQQLGTDELKRRCVCVTEAGGNTPKRIETRFDPEDGLLNGTKAFATLGTHAESLLVVAARGDDSGERKHLVWYEVPANADGVTVTPLDPPPFCPELTHARVEFDNVALDEDEALIISNQGWNHVKGFRALEDLFVLGALLAWLIRLSRATGNANMTHRLVALWQSVRATTEAHPGDGAVVAYAGAHELTMQTLEQFDWSGIEKEVQRRWQRDHAILSVASKAREARIEKVDHHHDLHRAQELERWDWTREDGAYEGRARWTDDGWIEWSESETRWNGGGGHHKQPIRTFLRKGGPSWVPEEIAEAVRKSLSED